MDQIRQDARIRGWGGRPNFGNARILGAYGPLTHPLRKKFFFSGAFCCFISKSFSLRIHILSPTVSKWRGISISLSLILGPSQLFGTFWRPSSLTQRWLISRRGRSFPSSRRAILTCGGKHFEKRCTSQSYQICLVCFRRRFPSPQSEPCLKEKMSTTFPSLSRLRNAIRM